MVQRRADIPKDSTFGVRECQLRNGADLVGVYNSVLC